MIVTVIGRGNYAGSRSATFRIVASSVSYRTHVQNVGWQGWRADGAMSGTSGRSLRLEAIQISLTGSVSQLYDVWYRVHAQNVGWMGWAKNGAQAGTAGYSYRLEAIQVVLRPKGSAASGSTANAFRQRGASNANRNNNKAARTAYDALLRSLYKKGMVHKPANCRFMDITGDGIDEMILSW